MKTLAIITLITFAACASFAQVQTIAKMLTTKHNLSASGSGPYRAATEQQLCVFCHTPHLPKQYSANQLWNHQMSGADYTLYSSDYLMDLKYDAPNQPNPRSKLCLSCHDGTVALGAVYNNQSSMNIGMMNDVQALPAGTPGNLGTSLANDHPVGYTYNPTKDPELIGRTWPWSTSIALIPDAENGTVECVTCHDPHDDQYGSFLRVGNTNAALCTFCHAKTGWSGAIHQSSQQSYTPSAPHPVTTLGEWACRSCHTSHNGAGSPYLLIKSEENTCFESGCHGSTVTGANTKNVQSEVEKIYSHPVIAVAGKHRNPDLPSTLDLSNRHAECVDCHNSHQAGKGLHTPGENIASNVLKGVAGVSPGFTLSWTQPSAYSDVKPSQLEYQICMKCHSSYAFGMVPDGVSSVIGPSGARITDQAMEFNTANHSAHPVETNSTAMSGQLPPQRLDPTQMTNDWGNTGTQSMYCSDCHGGDQATSPTVPQGPHGSNNKFMLTGTGKLWPTNAFGGLWSLADIKNGTNNWQNDLFCANCHPLYSAGRFLNNVHDGANHQGASVKCITCHVAIPHGSRRSRLIGYDSDVPPYNYAGAGAYDKLVINGFLKAGSPTGYVENNCSMSGVCHGTQFGAYEP
jgi:predicted CXXCH cytochrome family protein